MTRMRPDCFVLSQVKGMMPTSPLLPRSQVSSMTLGASAPRRVAILQRRLTHYRVPLFEQLRARLAGNDVELVLVHGQPNPIEAKKRDEGELSWAHRVVNRYVEVGGAMLCWQPLPPGAREASLLVLTQESSILSNYPLLAAPRGTRRRLAFWGHGANLQSRAPDGVRERWKRHWLHRVGWWFAYTGLTESLLIERGFPAERIARLENAIDTVGWRRELDAVEPNALHALRDRHGIPPGAPLGLYCGSLYADKRVDLLVAAAARIRERVPTFQLAVIGDGPEMGRLREQVRGQSWLHVTGALHGAAKATWFRAATLALNPGVVGLAVLDAFVAGLPLVTMRVSGHGPEIGYLRHGVNGLITEPDTQAFAHGVAGLLGDTVLAAALSQAASVDGRRYTIDNMARRYADGLLRALAAR